jgi:hypothetical protein
MEGKQLIDGKLVPVENNCLYIALQTYKQRHETDKNPVIVQMVIDDFVIIPHWYYRSDDWIEQQFLYPWDSIFPYVGPVSLADKRCYNSFKIYEELMSILPRSIDNALKVIPSQLITKLTPIENIDNSISS